MARQFHVSFIQKSTEGIGGLLILLLVIYGIIFYVPIIQDFKGVVSLIFLKHLNFFALFSFQ